jgi:hypothetical protein
MSLLFPSDEWIRALSTKLNESDSYERSAKKWEGDFVFIIEPDVQFKNTAYLFLGLYHGKSHDAAMLENADEKQAQYTLSAPYGTWLKVLGDDFTLSESCNRNHSVHPAHSYRIRWGLSQPLQHRCCNLFA